MIDNNVSLTKQDVEIIQHTTAYTGYFKIEKYRLKHRLFNGKWSKIIEREVFERGNAAGLLPYDPILNKIVLIEQFRIGAYGQTENPWLLEIVAGICAEHESMEEVAKRESREEANLSVDKLLPIADVWVSPGGTTEKVKLFCGQVDASHAGGIYGLKNESEDIRVKSFDLSEAYDLVRTGKICNAISVIAIQWLQINELMVKNYFAQFAERNKN